MSLPSLRELCLDLVASSAERFLSLQWSDGRFSTEPERETDEWNFFDQQYILAAALLYTVDHLRNPWCGSPRLWEAILRSGRHLQSRVAADGSMTWRLGGVVLPSPFVCQRLTCAWLLAYRLLKERLPEQEAQGWRAAILHACQWLAERKVGPHREVKRFTSHHVGTGTNHFSLYLSLLWLAGREFDRPEWVELASELMPRLIADQRPGGYWEEHHGPALGYNYLTYHGVDEYTAWSGDEAGIGALRTGLDLHSHWTYPDGIPVECIDGRMRRLSSPMIWGLAGFTRWPEGRGYARFLLERLRAADAQHGGETVARLAEAYLLVQEGEEAPPPPARPSYRATLDATSVVRKEGPWVLALSGQCSPPLPDNQFILDRQAIVSLWHQDAGLILNGSNSKFQPALATFSLPEAEGDDHLPIDASLVSKGRVEETLELRYPRFAATVCARLLDTEAVEVRFRATGHGSRQPVTLTLVPAVPFGSTLTVEGRGEVTLKEQEFSLEPTQHAGSLTFRGIRLRLPSGASIRYPVSPFNSYSADNTSPPSANCLVVVCPVGEQGALLRVEVVS